MKEIFEQYEKHGEKPTEEMLKKASHSYNKTMLSFMPENKQSKILDVGCGYGYFLYFLKEEGYTNFDGIDLSQEEIKFCKENISKNVSVSDAFNFLNENKDYDLIVANHILEHFSKDQVIQFLKLAKESLNKEGKLIIQVPNISNPFSLYSRYIDITHEIGFTEDSLRTVLRIAGFEKITIKGIMPEGSGKSKIRNFLSRITFKFVGLLFILQGFGIPKYLEPKLISVSKK